MRLQRASVSHQRQQSSRGRKAALSVCITVFFALISLCAASARGASREADHRPFLLHHGKHEVQEVHEDVIEGASNTSNTLITPSLLEVLQTFVQHIRTEVKSGRAATADEKTGVPLASTQSRAFSQIGSNSHTENPSTASSWPKYTPSLRSASAEYTAAYPAGQEDMLLFGPEELAYLEGKGISETSARSGRACGELLRIPKVALMFLTQGELYHEQSWTKWFHNAAGLYPVRHLYTRDCSGGAGDCHCSELAASLADKLCAPEKTATVLDRQHLFNVYVHPLPSFESFPENSIFQGREIPDRVEAKWGAFSLVQATKNLMKAALKDSSNQRFMLLSESGIPLYPAAAIHYQLMAEDKSRVDACTQELAEVHKSRYHHKMGPAVQGNWRYSPQWVELHRHHAELVVEDKDFHPIFQNFCISVYDEERKRNPDMSELPDCHSEEHYIPSLLANLQHANTTDCVGEAVAAEWNDATSGHPVSYKPDQVTAPFLKQVRAKNGECNAMGLIERSWTAYRVAGTDKSKGACPSNEQASGISPDQMELDYKCHMFARKFPKDTSDAMYGLFTDCSNGLYVTTGNNCSSAGEPENAIDTSLRSLLGADYVSP